MNGDSEADMDELDLFQQTEATSPVRSSGRPRRATRESTRYPRELSAKTTYNEAESRGARQRKPKRKAEEDASLVEDTDGVEIIETPLSSPSRATGKAKADAIDLNFLLTSPKSPLVGMEISDILNANTWFSLSDDARSRLEEQLPETAFSSYCARVDDCHPSRQCDRQQSSGAPSTSSRSVTNPATGSSRVSDDAMEDVRDEPNARGVLDISIFTDPHLESAARTFQDQLYTGWYTRPHRELVQKHLENVKSGKLHTPWKDDVWGQNHDAPDEDQEGMSLDPSASPKGKGRGIRGNAFEPLIKHNLLAVGDVLFFSKTFTVYGVSVEKDALVYSIHPKTHALTIITCSGTRRKLPGQLLVPAADISTSPIETREITVDSPMQLERALLDVDGRVPRPDHSHNALKCITMWRWPASSAETYTEPEMMQCISEDQLDRGGREQYGTLFYLRGTTNGE